MSSQYTQPLADLVTALEQDVSKLLARAADAEEAGNAGRLRASFQNVARQLHENGTLIILKIDEMVGEDETEAQRNATRALRKRLAIRVQTCSQRLGPFL